MPSIRYTHNKHEFKARRILQVVTDVNHYLDHPDHPTGLWLGGAVSLVGRVFFTPASSRRL